MPGAHQLSLGPDEKRRWPGRAAAALSSNAGQVSIEFFVCGVSKYTAFLHLL